MTISRTEICYFISLHLHCSCLLWAQFSVNDVASAAADIWKLTLDAMISESEIDLAYLVWGSVFTTYLLYHNLIPSNSVSSIILAYKQHLQNEGGKIDLLPSAIFMADSSSKEQVLVIIVPVGLPSELQQCAPEHFLVVDSGATVHCWWDAICTSRLKEQNCSIGGIDSGSRAVCIAIGHLCGMTFCKNKSNNWSKVLITSGNHDAWVIPTSARQLFSQIRAKIQGPIPHTMLALSTECLEGEGH